MLHLASIIIAADFLNSLDFQDVLAHVHIQLISCKKYCFSSYPAQKENILNKVRIFFFPFSLAFFDQFFLLEDIFATAATLILYFFKKEFIIR